MKPIYSSIAFASLSAALVLPTGCVVQTTPVRPGVVVTSPGPYYQIQSIRVKAEQGDAIAQFTLGSCFATGRGVVRDSFQAVHWYSLSAQQGYAPAQYRLGVCYATGRGVPRDGRKAAECYRQAAEQGYAAAEYSLSVCYALGRGLPRSRADAIHWCRKAAEQRYVAAQRYLAVLESGPVVAESQPGGPGVSTPNSPAPEAAAPPPAEAPDASAQAPLTFDELKMLSTSGIKADVIVAEIKNTNAKFSQQDIDAAQQLNPPVDPEVINCMKQNLR